jgi:methionine-gamma-lyase
VTTHPAPGRPVAEPLHQSAIFAFDGPDALAAAMAGPDGAFAYTGYTNPTVRAFEDAMTALEGGAAALATATGSAATAVVLHSTLRTGDHVVAQRALYGGTGAALADLAARWGVDVTTVVGDDPAELRAALRPGTRVLVLETIANPTGFVPDLPALAAEARRAGVLVVVDNTFATPLLCRPFEHGADVVVHSATKYLGGHHDVVGGVAVFADQERYRAAWAQALRLGTAPDPFAAWLILRGLKTLRLRVREQDRSAAALAARLAEHPAVGTVHHPGRPEHPSHARATRLLSGFGGTLAFDLADGDAVRAVLRALRVVLNAPSLGGTETTAMHPASTSHRSLDEAALLAAGISAGTVRISLGLEPVEELWADLEQALARAPRPVLTDRR